MVAFGLYNCIASACIGGVWGGMVPFLDVPVFLSPWIPLCCAAPEVCDGAGRRWLTDFEGLDGTIFGSIIV